MLKSFSNKAIASKARAMYGKAMTAADYEELMKKRSVPEAAAYLRDNTHYREVLGRIDPDSIHRGQLEHQLRSLRYTQYQRLIAYDFSRERGFYQYIYLRDELDQLVNLLRYLGGGSDGQYNFSYSEQLVGHCSYDLAKLVTLTSYQELMAFLGNSPYGKILAHYPPNEEESKNKISLLSCERDLSTYYYTQVLGFIQSQFSGGAAQALTHIVYSNIDAENVSQTYRLKRFFKSSPAFIQENLLPFSTPSQKLIRRMIAADTSQGVQELLAASPFGANAPGDDTDFVENLIFRHKAAQSKKNLRYSVHAAVVLVAYMTQLELELENIINIIESVRYGLPIDEMRRMLIL